MNKTLLAGVTFVTLLFSACQKDVEIPTNEPSALDIELEEQIISLSDGDGKSFFLLPDSDDYANIPQDPLNPITEEKVMLGRLLFHETGIGLLPKQGAGMGTYSCASCHFAGAGFQAGRVQGIGEGGLGIGLNGEGRVRSNLYKPEQLDVQPVRTPSAMNGAYQKNMLWNGQFGATGVNIGTEDKWTSDTPKATNFLGYEGLEIQAIAGLGVHRLKVDYGTLNELGYIPLFDLAFGNIAESDRYTKERAGQAIAAYERTVMANESPWQKYLRGELAAMTDQEKRGASLFLGKAECGTCHTGPALNSMEFHALGMHDLYTCPEEIFMSNPNQADHLGRGGFTGNKDEEFQFKVPQLYNLKDSPFYGHGSSFRSIRGVLEYKNNAKSENSRLPAGRLSELFQPLDLTNEEISDITSFLATALYDANLMRYQPTDIPSGNCTPMNDALSKEDLGCN
ncbi:MAG: cytochrome-c peroxidase [Saprospiraceae bacterium]